MQGIIVRASNAAGYATYVGEYDHGGRKWFDAEYLATFDYHTQAVTELSRRGVTVYDEVTERGQVVRVRLLPEGDDKFYEDDETTGLAGHPDGNGERW